MDKLKEIIELVPVASYADNTIIIYAGVTRVIRPGIGRDIQLQGIRSNESIEPKI